MGREFQPLGVDVDDILAAMRQAGSYLDITPSDALSLYRLALGHALSRLRLGISVERLMTREVRVIAADAPAAEAAALLAETGFSGAPVLEGDTLVGVLSFKDFLPRLGLPRNATPMALVAERIGRPHGGDAACGECGFAGLAARDLMTAPALTIGPEAPIGQAATLMETRGVNRLPVLHDGALVGIISRGDVVRASQSLAVEE